MTEAPEFGGTLAEMLDVIELAPRSGWPLLCRESGFITIVLCAAPFERPFTPGEQPG